MGGELVSQAQVSIDYSAFTKAAYVLQAKHVSGEIATVVKPVIREAARLTTKEARREFTPHNRTNRLARRIGYRLRGAGLALQARVGTGRGSNLVIGDVQPHTEPHVLMPLHVGWSRSTVTGFSVGVHHPGYRGDPFFARAIDRTEPQVKALTDKAASALAAALAKQIGGI